MKRRLSVAIVSLTLVVAPSCTGEYTRTNNGARTLEPDAVADRYGYDPSTTNLTPVFALIPQYHDPRDGYARDLLAQQCLRGIVDYEPVDLGEPDEFFDQRTGQPVFTEEIAQRWGYSANRLNPPSGSAVQAGVTITDAQSAAMVECGQDADERLGRPPERLPTEIEVVGWQSVESSESVAAAAALWRDCMDPAGVPDLPASPAEMPAASLTAMAGVTDEDGNTIPDPNIAPSAREIEVAVLDARCRKESGYDDAVFDARIEAELIAIGRNTDEFDAVREDYERYASGVDEVIIELG